MTATYTKMDPVIKAEWIDGLRSGEYTQTQSQLCNIDGEMCCLGVLIDTSIDASWVELDKSYHYGQTDMQPGGWGIAERGHSGAVDLNGYVEASALPEFVLKKAKVDARAEETLIRFNDVSKKSFKFIANWIEKNL